jgi:hypothetical protein
MLFGGVMRYSRPASLSLCFSTVEVPEPLLADDLRADALQRTQNWVEKVIVKKGVCPFAAKPLKVGGVKIVVSESGTYEAVLEDIEREALEICKSGTCVPPLAPDVITTLIVAPHPSLQFSDDYHAQVHFSWEIMALLSNLELIPTVEDPKFGLQVVNFHPRGVKSVYSDAGAEAEDYVVRSPFPTFHLLREADMFEIAKPNSGYPDANLVPQRNAKMLAGWGLAKCQQLWGV